ncbi:MAG: four-carbon acid sugar kinase family protein [Pseudomonadota bacterium]
MPLRYAWYGDDFTGASDTLATLAAAGRRALLFLGPPTPTQLAAAGPLDALGVAGIARALGPEAMRDELAPVARCFADLAPAITHYKCCSTFDSAARIGNLAIGAAALRRPDHDPVLSVVGGQPSLGRYCAFGELYATAQAGGEVHRIDRHPTMSRHPVTPMHEADLRRHLHSLGMGRVALIDLRALDASAGDPDALEASVRQALAADSEALLFDALHEQHLRSVGAWLWRRAALRPQLVLGASSVAQAALAQWPDASDAALDSRSVAAAASPVFVLVGSLSPVTAAQVQHAGALYESVPIDPARLLGGGAALDALAGVCAAALARGRSVMARTVAPTEGGPAPLDVARICAELLARVLALSPQLRRIGVAGGDTSSLALRALGASALAWSGHLAPGVALTRVHAEGATLDGLELMLKGGQMGPPDLFLRLLHGTP